MPQGKRPTAVFNIAFRIINKKITEHKSEAIGIRKLLQRDGKMLFYYRKQAEG